jgi:hypothetical protein
MSAAKAATKRRLIPVVSDFGSPQNAEHLGFRRDVTVVSRGPGRAERKTGQLSWSVLVADIKTGSTTSSVNIVVRL